MNDTPSPDAERKAIAEAALRWKLELSGDASLETRQKFCDWLCRSPLHVQEMLNVEAAYELARSHVRLHGVPAEETSIAPSNIVTLRADAPETLALDRTVSADESATLRIPRAARFLASPAGRLSAAPLAILLIVGVVTVGLFRREVAVQHTYRSAADTQRALGLADGSVLTLDPATVVHVVFSPRERRISLERGSASFVVRSEANRRFTVFTDYAQILAVGTEFEVFRGDTTSVSTTITVQQGRVRVSAANAVTPTNGGSLRFPFDIDAGRRIEIDANAAARDRTDERAAATPCRHGGKYEYTGVPLAIVVRLLNQCTSYHVTVKDPTTAARLLTGVVSLDHLESVVKLLESDSTLSVEHTRDGIELRERSHVAAAASP